MRVAAVVVLLIPLVSILLWLVWSARERRRSPSSHGYRVRIVASVEAPNRDLSATLPRRSQASATVDRHFGYERVRDPRYRSDVDGQLAESLKPVQVIRVNDTSEREVLRESIPPHIRAVFIEDDPPTPNVQVPPPRRTQLGD